MVNNVDELFFFNKFKFTIDKSKKVYGQNYKYIYEKYLLYFLVNDIVIFFFDLYTWIFIFPSIGSKMKNWIFNWF